MTGNFNIMMAYPLLETSNKEGWLVQTKNITKSHFFNYAVVAYINIINLSKCSLERLLTNRTNRVFNRTYRVDSDQIRPLYINEYIDLAFALKKQGFRYNKKTDKLTTV